jgi:hypothetical protein
MNTSPHFFSGKDETLAEIETRRQLLDGGLARTNFRHGSSGLQPLRKCLLASASACRTEQLKETGGAKDIEIPRIGMSGVEKALTGLSCACPAILDAADASLVIGAQPREITQTAQDTLVKHGKDDKEQDRDEEKKDFRRTILHKPDGYKGDQQAEDEFGRGEEIVTPLMPRD